jgi:hypothetical protein
MYSKLSKKMEYVNRMATLPNIYIYMGILSQKGTQLPVGGGGGGRKLYFSHIYVYIMGIFCK